MVGTLEHSENLALSSTVASFISYLSSNNQFRLVEVERKVGLDG